MKSLIGYVIFWSTVVTSCLIADDSAITHIPHLSTENRPTATSLPNWEQEIGKYVKTLSREVDSYHWTSLKKMSVAPGTTVPSQGEALTNYVNQYLSYYRKDNGESVANYGAGLYLAIDPAITAYYDGKEDWAVIKLPLKSGAHFADFNDVAPSADFKVSPNINDVFSPEILGQLKNLGCDALSVFAMFSQCHPLLVKALDDLGVSFYSYEYRVRQLDGFPARPAVAFVLTSDAGVDWDNAKVFSANVVQPESESDHFDRSIIVGAFHLDQRGDNFFLPGAPDRVAPWSNVQDPPPQVLKDYLSVHYFGCRDYPEDKTSVIKSN